MSTVITPSNASLEAIWREHIPLTEASTYALLWGRYPAWRLQLDGTFIAANLLAAWLWVPPQPPALPDLSALLERNVFYDVYATNISRIPIKNKWNRGFFEAKLRIEYNTFGGVPSAPLAEARRMYPELQSLYTHMDKSILDNLWQYQLRIIHPLIRDALLEFKVTVSAVVDVGKPAGFFALYQPLGETCAIMERVYDEVTNSRISYVRSTRKIGGGVREVKEKHELMRECEIDYTPFDLAYPRTKDDYNTTKRPIPEDEGFWSDYFAPLLSEDDVQKTLGLERAETVFKLVEQKKLLAVPT